MSKHYRTIVSFMLIALIASCGAPATVTQTESILSEPQIARYPEPADYSNLHSYTNKHIPNGSTFVEFIKI